MINSADLVTIANNRLEDAEALLKAHRYDGAIYMCGYAIEIALKHKICQTLNWSGFPSSGKEFENYKCLRTHDLDVLLSFTGIETNLLNNHFLDWSAISIWNPESRYNLCSFTAAEASPMISSAKILISLL